MEGGWQGRRAAFNHDWLKNRYLIALQKWMNLLDGRVEDPEFEARFAESVLPGWEDRVPEAAALIAAFEEEMSPRALFWVPPLSACGEEVTSWLPDVVHELWLARHPVREWVRRASEALSAAAAAYAELRLAVLASEDPMSAAGLRPLRGLFAAFADRCRDLGSAIGAFPSEVLVA